MTAESAPPPGSPLTRRILPVAVTGLGVLAAVETLWWLGPLVAFGGVRPFESASIRWALTACILIAVLGAAGWRLIRADRRNRHLISALSTGASSPASAAASAGAEAAMLRTRFDEALAILKRERLGRSKSGRQRWSGLSLYQLPWYVFIGAPGSGKTTALVNSGLEFPLADRLGTRAIAGMGGTRNCEWWFSSEAVLIDTAGRYTSQDSAPDSDAKAWAAFLRLLKQSRPRQPINGVLLTVSVADLVQVNPAARAAHSRQLQRRLQELERHLGIRFPVYVLVTKTDLLPGFGEFFASLNRAQREQVWGVTFPFDDGAPAPAQGAAHVDLRAEFDRLEARLNECLIARLHEERALDRRASLYEFPQQWRMFSHLLTRFLDDTVALGGRREGAIVRGVYFTSGTQEGMPLDRVLRRLGDEWGLSSRVLQAAHGQGRSYFVTRLLRDVVIAEASLAGTNLAWERRRARVWRATGVACAAVCMAAIALWTWRYTVSARLVADRSAQIAALDPALARMRSAPRSDPAAAAPLLNGVYALSREDESSRSALGRFGMRYLGLDRSEVLAATARASYRDLLRQAFLPRLAVHLEEEIRARKPEETELLYEALKAYLMLFGGRNFNSDQLRAYLAGEWATTLAAPERASLVAHLDRLLAGGEVGAPELADAALVEQARAQIRRVPVPERIYARLKHLAADGGASDLTLAGALGPAAERVFVHQSGTPIARGIPGLYTRDGYEHWVRAHTRELARQFAQEESWVMGAAAGTAPEVPARDAGTESRLADAVEQLYFTDYARLWQAFLGDLRLVRLPDVAAMTDLARSFSRPDSPFIGLVATAAREVSLPGLAHAGSTDDVPLEGIRQLGANLGPFTQEMESLFGRTTAYLVAIDQATQGKSELPSGDALRGLTAAAARMPAPIGAIVDQFSGQASAAAAAAVRDILRRRITTEVAAPCAALVADRFPLTRTSPDDIPREAFERAFAAGGLFDSFFQRQLAAFVDRTGTTWRFRPPGGLPSKETLPALAAFQQAQALRDAFFHDGGRVLGIQIDLTLLDLDRALKEVVIDLDGQEARFSAQSRGPHALQWPGPEQPGRAEVQAVSAAGPVGPGFRFDGAWALFRMLDHVRVEPVSASSPNRVVLRFDIEGHRARLEWATRTENPLRAIPEGFRCPLPS
jgi:type VI secretion system protein ImpL